MDDMYDESVVFVFPRTCPVCGLDCSSMTAEEMDKLVSGNSSYSQTMQYICGSSYMVFAFPDYQSRGFEYLLNLIDPCEMVLYEGKP